MRAINTNYRFWIPAGLLFILALCVVAAFITEWPMRYLVPDFMVICGIIGLSGWWVLLTGRFRWRFLLIEIGVAAILIVLAMATLRYDGSAHGGRPLAFTWKWTPTIEESLAAFPATAEPSAIPASSADDPDLADFPGFLGEEHDGVAADLGFDPDWAANPPEELWRIQVGLGWSAFVVGGERAVTQEQRSEEELVTCYHVRTGQLLWSHSDSARFNEAMGGIGPRATPTIVGDVVYALGATGILNALKLDSGELIWRRSTLKDGGGTNLMWGKSASPLVVADLVIVTGSNSTDKAVLAYDRANGDLVWTAGRGPASYSTPRLLNIGGVEQVVAVLGENVSGFEPATGELLWQYEWPGAHPKVAQPLQAKPQQLLVTASYSTPSTLIDIQRSEDGTWSTKEIWGLRQMKTKFSSAVIKDGYAYGIDEGKLICMNVATGKRVWKGGRYGYGQNLMVGDKLLIQAENGDVALVQLTPDDYVEVARISVLGDGKTWNAPALAGKYLLVRNDHEAVALLLH